MKLNELLLPEFDQELALTRSTLERLPDGRFDWKPHDRSMTLGRLAGHLAELPSWAIMSIRQDELDLAPAGVPAFEPFVAKSRQDVLSTFDKNRNDARAAIADATDEHLLKAWSLLRGGQTLMTIPRVSVIRNWVMNHMIHHRAQLGVYLRLNNIAVPSIYGPSADEGQRFQV